MSKEEDTAEQKLRKRITQIMLKEIELMGEPNNPMRTGIPTRKIVDVSKKIIEGLFPISK
jgi:hypothetical protein